MGFLSKFLGLFHVDHNSNDDIRVIKESAERYVAVINESLTIANNAKNITTKKSRLGSAKNKLHELKKLSTQYGFLELSNLNDVQLSIQDLEHEISLEISEHGSDKNILGEKYEQEGSIDKAISVYASLVSDKTDTPFTYRRLAILYKKQKNHEKELMAIKAALQNVPKSNKKHYEWFQDSLAKLEKRQC